VRLSALQDLYHGFGNTAREQLIDSIKQGNLTHEAHNQQPVTASRLERKSTFNAEAKPKQSLTHPIERQCISLSRVFTRTLFELNIQICSSTLMHEQLTAITSSPTVHISQERFRTLS
jgi:hypothetical protein